MTAAANAVAVIKGQVTDADTGEPLPYVSVLLNGETPTGGIIKTGQSSDEEGYFRFGDLATG
ncbi:MAG: carboxypeptidase regulatory-like domain-containing protein, partial [Candidatus Latescibacterota bacterium]